MEKNQKRLQIIRQLIKKGYSANKIQKTLQKRKMGMNRQKLLQIIRQYKSLPKKPHVYKYTPKKYRKPKPEIPTPKKGNRYEYTKYYTYTSKTQPSRNRYLEARLAITLQQNIHPLQYWHHAERLIDDYVNSLGFDTYFFRQTKSGVDYLGKSTLPPYLVCIDKQRGYKWEKWLHA